MKNTRLVIAGMFCISAITAQADDFIDHDGVHTTDHSITVLSVTTDEGFIYDYSESELSGSQSAPTVPTSYNNISSYTYSTTSGDSVVTNTVTIGDNYQSLTVYESSSSNVIQPVNSTDQTDDYITPLLESDADYLNAGSNGMSLSTGINKTPKYDPDSYVFSLSGFDVDIVGDGGVDFFAADIAYNQSSEEISIWDDNGNIIAEYVMTPADWDAEIGWQQVDRINTDGSINYEDFIAPVSVIAIELSDFTLTEGWDWDMVATNAAFIQVDVPALDDDEEVDDDNPPKTDYAFLFAVNTDEIDVTPMAIPEAQSAAYILFTLGIGMGIRRFFT